MRIKIVRKPTTVRIDDLQLDQFDVGQEYEVGWRVGSLMLVEGWAQPVEPANPETPAETRHGTNLESHSKAADRKRSKKKR